MQVILLQDVKGLGKAGDLVEVKAGYANNCLFKQKMALEATAENMNGYKMRKAAEQAKAQKLLAEATAMANQLQSKKITLPLKCGEGGRLYGAVTSQNIADELAKQGFSLDKRNIHLKDTIKALGKYELDIRLHTEVAVRILVEVVPL